MFQHKTRAVKFTVLLGVMCPTVPRQPAPPVVPTCCVTGAQSQEVVRHTNPFNIFALRLLEYMWKLKLKSGHL